MSFRVHIRFNINESSSESLETKVLKFLEEQFDKEGAARHPPANQQEYDIYLIEADAPQTDQKNIVRELVQRRMEQGGFGLGHGTALFLSRGRGDSELDSLENQVASSPQNNSTDASARSDYEAYRENQFYLETLVNYGLGRLVFMGNNSLTESDRELPEFFRETLRQIAAMKPEDFPDLQARSDEIRNDIETLYKIASEQWSKGTESFDAKAPVTDEEAPDLRNLSASEQFLYDMAALYPLGRLGNEKAELRIKEEVGWMQLGNHKYGGSYQISNAIEDRLRQTRETNRPISQKQARELVDLELMLGRYRVTRDMARCLSAGAPHWGREIKAKLNKPLRILIIDENLQPNEESGTKELRREATRRRLIQSLMDVRSILCDGIDYFVVADWTQLKPALNMTGHLEVCPLSNENHATQSQEISSFDVILTEVEFQRRVMGPQIVRWLDEYFMREKRGDPRPRIMVFSRSEHIGHVHQCLAHGAEAYVLKHRIYAMAARLAKVRHPLPIYPDGLKSNFLALYEMLPQRILELQSQQANSLISGIDNVTQEKQWLQMLPKADLHFHMGTSISLDCIEFLALNSTGYLLRDLEVHADSSSGTRRYEAAIAALTETVWKIVLHFGAQEVRVNEDPLQRVVLAAKTIIPTELEHLKGREPICEDNVFDRIVEALSPPDKQISAHHACSLFVSVIGMAYRYFQAGKNWDAAIKEWENELSLWDYFSHLDRLGTPSSHESDPWFLRHKENALGAVQRLARHRVESNEDRRGEWARFGEDAKTRSKHTLSYLRKIHEERQPLGQQSQESKIGNYQPSLAELVQLPAATLDRQNLLRYLAGAGLLGAEHLQYPENIVLAAHDIVKQSVNDRILYSEVRCETTGYTRAGMPAPDVTDLLCRSFDLSVLWHVYGEDGIGNPKDSNWIRINVLLGAKRHKKPEACREIVSLLTYYLQRDYTPRDKELEAVPRWWRPSKVVGFDLSGDENQSSEKFEKIMEPLYTYCSPITIHAGEAATAESIWAAVHEFGARRIGHGLRLRENSRLLSYCVSAGLCMELCPTSNEFTNYFNHAPSRLQPAESKRLGSGTPLQLSLYPLLDFMEAGLDVCLNTDNRQLHQNGMLSDEYLCAARMAGGLTRWEVLKLVRSGFKKAFLPKEQIVEIMRHVESQLFKLADDGLGRDW